MSKVFIKKSRKTKREHLKKDYDEGCHFNSPEVNICNYDEECHLNSPEIDICYFDTPDEQELNISETESVAKQEYFYYCASPDTNNKSAEKDFPLFESPKEVDKLDKVIEMLTLLDIKIDDLRDNNLRNNDLAQRVRKIENHIDKLHSVIYRHGR